MYWNVFNIESFLSGTWFFSLHLFRFSFTFFINSHPCPASPVSFFVYFLDFRLFLPILFLLLLEKCIPWHSTFMGWMRELLTILILYMKSSHLIELVFHGTIFNWFWLIRSHSYLSIRIHTKGGQRKKDIEKYISNCDLQEVELYGGAERCLSFLTLETSQIQ